MRYAIIMLMFICSCGTKTEIGSQSNGTIAAESEKIKFKMNDAAVVNDYERYLKENLVKDFDKILLYPALTNLETKDNLGGMIIVSDDGLFYKTKEEVEKNSNVNMDDFMKSLENKSEEELLEMAEAAESMEKSISLEALKVLLIDLKNKKVNETADSPNTWIYLETEGHSRMNDIIDVLVTLKELNILFKPYQGKY